MADRRSVWNDPRLRELAESYVCAADEVWRLQRGSDADCVFFQRMVNGGERITDRGTRQGTWICAPSGKLLAAANTRDVERMVALLEEGLRLWDELPEADRRLADGVELTPGHRWESNRPEGGLVLERIGRELAADGLASEPGGSWNRDFAWFARDELVAALPSDLAVGSTVELPRLARRLARFHLIDNVRGQSLPYADEEVRAAELVARVTSRGGSRVTLRLEGRTDAVAEGPWRLGDTTWRPTQDIPHGMECRLLGDATWDGERGAFEAFRLVGVGRRWGHTQMNGRWRDPAPGLVAFAFTPSTSRVAPAFVSLYDADWIVPPDVPTWRDDPAEVGLEP